MVVINCENYVDGECRYIPKSLKIAICQKCYYASLTEEDRNDAVKNCMSKTLIEKLRERDRILRLTEPKIITFKNMI